jgi:cellulose synthase/poly-beta-1,6-N-acetylglucosamine synthase-like glycosyltransferase
LISGAFGTFRKYAVIEVGGFRTDTVGEDMELIMRLHRHYRLHGKPYRITHIPEPICWTEAPESLRILRKQRVRWQRGLSESLSMNWGLFLNRRGGLVGWVAFPFYVAFEWLSPIVEVGGYAFTLFAYFAGFLSTEAMVLFLAVALGFGIFLSVSTLLMEEVSFHIYPGLRHVLMLSIISVLENFGYRQLNAVWKFWGLFQWVFGLETAWERDGRKASWQKD